VYLPNLPTYDTTRTHWSGTYPYYYVVKRRNYYYRYILHILLYDIGNNNMAADDDKSTVRVCRLSRDVYLRVICRT